MKLNITRKHQKRKRQTNKQTNKKDNQQHLIKKTTQCLHPTTTTTVLVFDSIIRLVYNKSIHPMKPYYDKRTGKHRCRYIFDTMSIVSTICTIVFLHSVYHVLVKSIL